MNTSTLHIDMNIIGSPTASNVYIVWFVFKDLNYFTKKKDLFIKLSCNQGWIKNNIEAPAAD